MEPHRISAVLSGAVAQQLLTGDMPARLAYIGLDGAPRAVPLGFLWNGAHVVMCTSTNAPKVGALRRNESVALTIDTNEQPPDILLIRGTAELETVDGIPDEYVEMSRRLVPDEQWDAWLQEVTSLYDQMVRIKITPTWAKVIDFENTLPQAVEELVRRRAASG